MHPLFTIIDNAFANYISSSLQGSAFANVPVYTFNTNDNTVAPRIEVMSTNATEEIEVLTGFWKVKTFVGVVEIASETTSTALPDFVTSVLLVPDIEQRLTSNTNTSGSVIQLNTSQWIRTIDEDSRVNGVTFDVVCEQLN